MSHTPLWRAQLENEKNSRKLLTLTSSIDHFYKTHSVVHYKLFSIGIFYCWVIRLLCESEVSVKWVGDGLPTTHLCSWRVNSSLVCFGWGEVSLLTNKAIQSKLKSQRMIRIKMWDNKPNKPELPRQFYPHHRHQERPLSSYPFLHFIGKIFGDLIDRKKYLRKARGSVNADKSKLSRSKLEVSETEWRVMWDGRKLWRMMVQKE